jgi:hypothetical protein
MLQRWDSEIPNQGNAVRVEFSNDNPSFVYGGFRELRSSPIHLVVSAVWQQRFCCFVSAASMTHAVSLSAQAPRAPTFFASFASWSDLCTLTMRIGRPGERRVLSLAASRRFITGISKSSKGRQARYVELFPRLAVRGGLLPIPANDPDSPAVAANWAA